MINSEVVAGEPFEITFAVKSDPETAKPITDYAALIELRDKNRDGALLQSWNDSSEEIVRNDTGGTLTLTISAEDTRAYSFRGAYLDLLLTKGEDGIRSESVSLFLKKGVTR